MEALFFIIAIVGIVLIMRLFGSWMFRINEIITLQKQILDELKKFTDKKGY